MFFLTFSQTNCTITDDHTSEVVCIEMQHKNPTIYSFFISLNNFNSFSLSICILCQTEAVTVAMFSTCKSTALDLFGKQTNPCKEIYSFRSKYIKSTRDSLGEIFRIFKSNHHRIKALFRSFSKEGHMAAMVIHRLLRWLQPHHKKIGTQCVHVSTAKASSNA